MAVVSLVDLLETTAKLTPGHEQYRVVGRSSSLHLTLAEVRDVANRVASRLAAQHLPGCRAVLLLPNPAAFIAGFFGTITAGLIAVPAATPGRSRISTGLEPLRGIVDDCDPSVVITTRTIRDRVLDVVDHDDRLRSVEWQAIEDLTATSDAARIPPARVDPETIAYLQYTSGSTSAPKGVQITHRAVLANLATIDTAFANSTEDHGMIWLPSHHDMGLLGGILAPLFSRMTVTLATPQQFLQSPASWLRWISDTGATISGAPDFAYRLCVERIQDEQIEGLDLSRWRLAFSGAEQVRAETIEAFSERFRHVGFRPEAFYPCYGLAEATLMVTGTDATAPVRSIRVGRQALSEGGAADPRNQADTRTLVSCGRAVTDRDAVAIVDPDDLTVLPENRVGEIWYSGPSAGSGYHRRGASGVDTFRARLADDHRDWLRTGDLGFMRDGDLFVTGRLREIVVVRGRNLDAADIDQALQDTLEAPRLGMVAALNPNIYGHERLVIAIEAGHSARSIASDLIDAVQSELAIRFGVRADEVTLIRAGSLPRTTSGKLKRSTATQRYEQGLLAPLPTYAHQGSRR